MNLGRAQTSLEHVSPIVVETIELNQNKITGRYAAMHCNLRSLHDKINDL